MNTSENEYSISLIAALLGISIASIERWVESGKLKCNHAADGKIVFTLAQLAEFAGQYNVSMKFLENEFARLKGYASSEYKKISAAQ